MTRVRAGRSWRAESMTPMTHQRLVRFLKLWGKVISFLERQMDQTDPNRAFTRDVAQSRALRSRPALSLSTCVTSGKSVNFSRLPFQHVNNGDF